MARHREFRTAETTALEAKQGLAPGQEYRLLKSFRRSPTAWVGILLLLVLAFMAILAPMIAPHDPKGQELPARLKPPMWMEGGEPTYPLGADRVGRDVLSNIVYGLRISLLVGFSAIAISAFIGIPLGVIAGYYRGRVDAIIMRAVDAQLSLPTVLLALGTMAIWGRGVEKLILVIGFVGWAYYARTARGSTLSMGEKEFVEAARALGTSDLKIMLRHIFPNIVTPLIILVSVELPRVVLLEATLSFLGVGVPIDTPSLGGMINSGYQVLFSGRWWLSGFPGIVLMMIVFGVNLLGDWLRDALDPRLNRQLEHT